MSARVRPLVACAAVALCSLAHAQTELRLWPGAAPGSEHWSIPESITTSASGDRVITNVLDPSLTVFLPDPAIATGAAAVIAPGGALRALALDNEGVKLAQWLNERGVAGFVLKYRTPQQDPSASRGPLPGVRAPGSAPRQELVIVNGNANPAPDDAALAEVLELAVADAQAALELVRRRAAEWRIDPTRVGIIGFSAGGGVAVGTAHFNATNGCLALFAAWKAAGKPAEIHVYDGISSGFGMTNRAQ
jgi:hypothetical protein